MMIIPAAQAERNPATNASVSLSSVFDSEEIKAAKVQLAQDEAKADTVNKWLVRLLMLYGLLSLAVAFVSLWSVQANRRLRRSDNVLSSLYQDRAIKAQTDLFNAEQSLAAISKTLVPRVLWFNFERFVKALEDKPKAPVVVLFQKDNTDAESFANELAASLKKAGWTVTGPTAYPVYEEYGEFSGSGAGVTIVSSSPLNRGFKWDLSTPFGVLMNAFVVEGSGALGLQREKFPNTVKLVVNRRAR